MNQKRLPVIISANSIILEIEDFRLLRKQYGVGESICSELATLNLKYSLGRSVFILQIYPNGQYDSYGEPTGYLTIYLKLISCENENVQPNGYARFSIFKNSEQKVILKFSTTKMKFILCKLCKTEDIRRNNFLLRCELTEYEEKKNKDFFHKASIKNTDILGTGSNINKKATVDKISSNDKLITIRNGVSSNTRPQKKATTEAESIINGDTESVATGQRDCTDMQEEVMMKTESMCIKNRQKCNMTEGTNSSQKTESKGKKRNNMQLGKMKMICATSLILAFIVGYNYIF